jgi:hypothetical protein
MRTTLFLFCFLFAARAHAGDSGSFQLCAGTIQQGERPLPVVLKINTQTGETWQLRSAPFQPAGGSISYIIAWAPVREDLVREMQKLQSALGSPNGPTPKPSDKDRP